MTSASDNTNPQINQFTNELVGIRRDCSSFCAPMRTGGSLSAEPPMNSSEVEKNNSSADPCNVVRAQPLLGTFVEISAHGLPQPELSAAINAAFAVIQQIHNLMSFHEADSDISRINHAPIGQAVTVHDWTYQVLQRTVELHQISDGVFDVTAPNPSGQQNINLRPDYQVSRAYEQSQINLGGIAKGFAVDRALDVLKQSGATQALVNAGGDIAGFGPSPQLVSIRDPRDPRLMLIETTLSNQALATSARPFDLHETHATSLSAILDPRSGTPAAQIIGASVKAPTCMIADALTKIVMLLGEKAQPILNHYQASTCFMTAQGQVIASANWNTEMRHAA
jgi:thiamine biosynthesis lipoprotein